MKAPIFYIQDFLQVGDAEYFFDLLTKISWEHRDAPRQEYYCNDIPEPYVYGKGKGQRLYQPQPWPRAVLDIRQKLEKLTSTRFEVCFLNRYLNQRDQLGWHADDSPEMDDDRPIAIVSLGVEREIWFRPKHAPLPDGMLTTADVRRFGAPEGVEKMKLGHGSLCLMAKGMQDTWQHRIPKASFLCGERISLTFRGYQRSSPS